MTFSHDQQIKAKSHLSAFRPTTLFSGAATPSKKQDVNAMAASGNEPQQSTQATDKVMVESPEIDLRATREEPLVGYYDTSYKDEIGKKHLLFSSLLFAIIAATTASLFLI